jgi:hypothetical protein
MHSQPPGFYLRRQAVARSEIEQDIGGVADHELVGFEKRRREWRHPLARFHHLHHRSHPAIGARNIGVAGTCLFQREADIFAAPLNARPVIEFVTHG